MEEYSQYEKLTVRLRELIQKYPMGIGIFKEMLQNADDAGAERVVFVLDWRTHHLPNLQHQQWQELAGPALLAFNDKPFSPSDFDGLKALGTGAKQSSLEKTGRFGYGFNSVYSLTDIPSFISDEYICFFDPHGFVVPETGPDNRSAGKREKLQDFSDPDLLKVYEVLGLYQSQQTKFPHTLFRFPFRTPQQAQNSEISNVTLTPDKAEKILQRLEIVGPELLLFLKSVLTIEVWEIHDHEPEIPRIRIETLNSQDVTKKRQVLLDILKTHGNSINEFIDFCENFLEQLPNVSYTHEICVKTADTTSASQRSTWRIVQGLWVGGTKPHSLTEVMRKLEQEKQKAVPWGGVAACISPFQPVEGKEFCFLPLPEPETTGLPIHTHGYFAIDNGRRGETHDSSEDFDYTQELKSEWNELLWKEVISVACAYLVRDLIEDVGKRDLIAFYKLWPLHQGNSYTEKLRHKFVKTLLPWEVVCDYHDTWHQLTRIYTLPSKHQNLLEPLKADAKMRIAKDLPLSLGKILKEVDNYYLPEITARDIRSNYIDQVRLGMPVEQAPRPSLQRLDWIRDLLAFCLSDGYASLTDLPFAVLLDGTLQRFGTSTIEIYWADDLQRKIFKDYPHWFLEPSIREIIGSNPKFEQIIDKTASLTRFTPELVAQRLAALSCWEGYDPKGGAGYLWKPDSEDIPNKTWAELVFQYFTPISSPLPRELRQVPLVPSLDGKLYPGGWSDTPYFYNGNLGERTEDGELKDKVADCFVRFQIPLVDTTLIAKSTVQEFLKNRPESKHNRDNLLHTLTPTTLIHFLAEVEVDQLPEYEETLYEELISYFARGAEKLGAADWEALRDLQIFPTETGELVLLGNGNGVALPPEGHENQKLPPIPLDIKLLKVKSWWQKLFNKLGISHLSESVLIKTYVLPVFEGLEPEKQLEVMKWMRSVLGKALQQSGAKDLKHQLTQTRLIRCTDGELRTPRDVYLPGADNAIEILGDLAYQPDMEQVYKGVGKTRTTWIQFFKDLGLLTNIRAQHLLDRAKSFQGQLTREGMAAVTPECLKLLDYLEQHWDWSYPEDLNRPEIKTSLCNHKVMDNTVERPLSQALRSKPWLPVVVDEAVLAQYPEHKTPQLQRLYRADEVVPLGVGNQVASQRYLLPREAWPNIMAALDFRAVKWSEVVKHFEVLLNCWQSNEPKPDQKVFEKALFAVYDYLNRVFADPRHWEQAQEKDAFVKKFSQEACLWDGNGHFWHPFHVFAVEVSHVFGSRRLFYKSLYPDLYKALGQRQQITWADYTSFLSDVQRLERGKVPEEMVQYVIASLNQMARLPSNPREAHKLDWILTEENWLKKPDDVLIPNMQLYLEPIREFKQQGHGQSQVHLLHDEVYSDFAKKMGCTSLAAMKTEGIGSIVPSSEQIEAKNWQRQIHSSEFEAGVRRLLAHTGQVKSPDTLNLTWFRQIKVQLTPNPIPTNLWWNKSGQRVMIARDIPLHCYVDGLLFHLVEDESAPSRLARALGTELEQRCGQGIDTSHLREILSRPSQKIEQYLDQEGIPTLLDRPEIPPDPAIAPENTTTATPIPPATPSPIETQPKTPVTPSPVGSTTAPTRTTQTTQNPSDRSPGSPPKSLLKLAGLEDLTRILPVTPPNSPPKELSPKSDSSKTGSKGASGLKHDQGKASDSGTKGGGFSKRTCIQAKREITTDDPESPNPDQRRIIGQQGVEIVVKYEKQQGRSAIVMDELGDNNPGYDIESKPGKAISTSDIRYIEVKSFQGPWPKEGARLTREQFLFGLQKGSQFWLYVVEYVNDPSRRKIHCIQNPAQQVQEFYFDEGWKEIALYDAGEWEEGQ